MIFQSPGLIGLKQDNSAQFKLELGKNLLFFPSVSTELEHNLTSWASGLVWYPTQEFVKFILESVNTDTIHGSYPNW